MGAPKQSVPDVHAREPAAEWVPLASLKPWAKNPRKNEAAVAKVRASIRRFGFAAPIVARRADREIIAGHTRFIAAGLEGIDPVPVRFLDVSATEAHALALADNRVGEEATWDKGGLADILEQLRDEDALDDALGFDDDEIARLLDPPDATVAEVDVSTVRDEFWLSVRGPLPDQPEALDALRLALARIPGCTVDVGTTKW